MATAKKKQPVTKAKQPTASETPPKVVTAKPVTAKASKAAAARPATKQPSPRLLPPSSLPFASTSMDEVLPARLQAVVDKSEIEDLLYTVGRGIDRIDETLLRSVFHPDATIDLGPGVFQGSCHDYVHWVMGVLGQTRETHHLIGNVRVTFEHEAALVESYCHGHFRLDKPTGREDVFIGSRFLDRMERRPSGPSGVWKIVHRKQIIDWVRTEAVSDLFYHQNPDALWSYRTKTDPSYQMAQFPGSQTNNKLPAFLGHRYDSKSVKF